LNKVIKELAVLFEAVKFTAKIINFGAEPPRKEVADAY